MGSITISIAEYEKLQEDSIFLECLQACGVDNWDYYDDAITMFEERDLDND